MEDLEVTLQRLEAASSHHDKLNILRDLARETERWREVAIYLADCHAATAEYAGSLSNTSRSQRQRLAEICNRAALMLAGTYGAIHTRSLQTVIDRLGTAASVVIERRK